MTRIRIVVGVLVVLALLVACIPLGINYFATQWLQDQGVQSPTIDSVDFNLFTGSAGIHDLVFSAAGERAEVGSVSVNIRWTSLLQGNIVLEEASLKAARFDVRATDDGRFTLGGLTLPLDEESPRQDQPSSPLSVGVSNLTIEDVAVHYVDDKIDSNILLKSISMDQIATWEKQGTTNLQLALQIDEAPLTINASVRPFLKSPVVEVDAELSRLSLASLATLAAESGIQAISGFVGGKVKTSVELAEDNTATISASGSISLDDISVGLLQGTLENESLVVTGNALINIPGDDDSGNQFSTTVDIKNAGFSFQPAAKPGSTIQFASLALGQLAINGLQKITLETLELQSLDYVVNEDEPLVTAGLIKVMGASISEMQKLTISKVNLSDFVARVIRAENGDLEGIPAGSPGAGSEDIAEPDNAAEAAAAGDSSFKFHLASFEMTGNSQIQILDQSVTPSMSMDLLVSHLGLQDLGNLDPQKPLQLSVGLRQGDSATVNGSERVV